MKPFNDLIDRIVSWVYVRRIYGRRCSEYEPGCPCCEAWRRRDELSFNHDREDGSK